MIIDLNNIATRPQAAKVRVGCCALDLPDLDGAIRLCAPWAEVVTTREAIQRLNPQDVRVLEWLAPAATIQDHRAP